MATPSITEKMKSLCIQTDEENKADVYKVPFDKQQIANGVSNCEIFKTDTDTTNKVEKIIMVVGATGTGKTTFINRMINYLFGVNYTDDIRFKLIDEKVSKSTKRQTTEITKYTIHQSILPYAISIIDTPGLNSTEGRNKEDNKTIDKIRDLFESGLVEAIDAICIVEKYNNIRLTENQTYVFQTIANIFGEDVANVIFIIATHCDEIFDNDTAPAVAPPVLEAFSEQKIPFKVHFSFNNKSIYEKLINNTSLSAQVKASYWNTSTTSFKSLLQELVTPVSLQLTKEILQDLFSIKRAQLPFLVMALRKGIHEIEDIQADRRVIKQMIEKPDTTDYTEPIQIIKVKMVPTDQPGLFSVKCTKCDSICHYPCDIEQENYSLRWCSVMSWFNLKFHIHCTVCRGQCSWRDHQQIKEREKFETHTEMRTVEQLQRRYMRDMKGAIELGQKTCNEKMLAAYDRFLKCFNDIQNCIDYINKHSLSKFPIGLDKFVDEIIESEENNKEDGYEMRINVLKQLVRMKKNDPSFGNNEVDLPQAIAFIEKCTKI